MNLRLVLALAAVFLGLGGLATTANASSGLGITEAGGSSFPGRAYVLSLPKEKRLSAGGIHVYENGQPVNGLTATPVSQGAAGQFAVVLVLDASNSMRGEPMTAALEAARTLASQRKPNQLLGLVTFNKTASVALPLTSDASSITEALAKAPKTAYGTHIYDAVDTAVRMLRTNKIPAGSIVVLSDGADTGSRTREAQAAADARGAHVRLYTVGLKSRHFDPSALQRLGRDAGGTYTEANNAARLVGIYSGLGSKLAREYLLRYESLAGPGRQIDVAVKVDGFEGVARAAYETPKLSVPAAAAPRAPYRPGISRRIWTSSTTMVGVGLLAALLVGLGAMAILSGPRSGTVRQRMAEFVSVPSALGDSKRRPTAQVTDKMLKGTHDLLRESTWWQKLRWELEVAAIGMPAEQIVILCVIASILSLIVLKFLTGWNSASSILFSFAFAIAIPFGVRSLLRRKLSRRRYQFAEQLPDNLQVLSSALRAGHSFIGALSVVVNDAPEPAKSEFQRVIADEQLGVPVDQALHVVVERMDNRDLEQVSLVAALQHETGGNTAEVLDSVTETIRERFELRRTVKTLTAQGRMSRWVLTALPVFLFLFVNLINPGYMHILYASTFGKVLIVLAGISVTAGSMVIKRIVNIKV